MQENFPQSVLPIGSVVLRIRKKSKLWLKNSRLFRRLTPWVIRLGIMQTHGEIVGLSIYLRKKHRDFSIKRNTSEKASRQTKLSVYCGYIVPILTYGSQVPSNNKGDLKKLESVQRRATIWIMNCGDIVSYSSRLATLGILPLSLYTELHDILLLSQIIQEKKRPSVEQSP